MRMIQTNANGQKPVMRYGFSAGSTAIANYDYCCRVFGFKVSERYNFLQQRMLYAKNVTPEGYSVWMLAHSDLNESFNRNRRWYNYFCADTIREVWFNPSDIKMSQEDYSCRVCFAKTRRGLYEFQGIYKPEKIEWEDVMGKQELVRTFRRVSITYPMGCLTDNGPIKDSDMSEREPKELDAVEDKCVIKAYILETKKSTSVTIDLAARPFQAALIGKKKGDLFQLTKQSLTYRIEGILKS